MTGESRLDLKSNDRPRVKNTGLKEEFRIGGRVLTLQEGNIGSFDGEAFFLLNLKDDRFPAPGPVYESILERDEAFKREGRGGKEIYDLVLEHSRAIPGASLKREEDSLTGEVFVRALFQSRPYQTLVVDVTPANWTHLRRIIFGNIGPDGEGILVHIWHPIAPQIPKLRSELISLLNNAFDTVQVTNTQSVAMPILTGNREPADLFFQVLTDIISQRSLPSDVTVYAYTLEDYKIGQSILKKMFKE